MNLNLTSGIKQQQQLYKEGSLPLYGHRALKQHSCCCLLIGCVRKSKICSIGHGILVKQMKCVSIGQNSIPVHHGLYVVALVASINIQFSQFLVHNFQNVICDISQFSQSFLSVISPYGDFRRNNRNTNIPRRTEQTENKKRKAN